MHEIEAFADNSMLEKLPPDSAEQQAHITAFQNDDGYNWGYAPNASDRNQFYQVYCELTSILFHSLQRYNPVLWGVPKGSYASNPNGSCRTIEFRKMVQVWTATFSLPPLDNDWEQSCVLYDLMDFFIVV